jgi:GNAT superfamily N-acetyltransferase
MRHGSSREIEYIQFSPHDDPTDLVTQVVECYRGVFADPPWNELYKCPSCGSHWGVKDLNEIWEMNTMHCGVPMVPFWPPEEVRADMYHEITPEASCWLALEKSKVVGFCWGYPISVFDLEAKLKVDGLAGKLVGAFATDEVAYQDEMGVLLSHRGHRIAKELFVNRHRDFIRRGFKVGVVRTRELPEPSVTYQWFTEKLGYQVIARYPVDDGRIVLARPLEGLSELLEREVSE